MRENPCERGLTLREKVMYAKYIAFGELCESDTEPLLDLLDHLSVCSLCEREMTEYLGLFRNSLWVAPGAR
jgi:hypothetical protein